MFWSSEGPQAFLFVKALYWNIWQSVKVHRDSPQHCIFMSIITWLQGHVVFKDYMMTLIFPSWTSCGEKKSIPFRIKEKKFLLQFFFTLYLFKGPLLSK